MNSEIITLSSDDDDDDYYRRPPPPRVKKSRPKTNASDRPCPKSKKKNRCGPGGRAETRDSGDGACARPAAAAARPSASAFARYPPPLPKVPRHATRRPSWRDVPPAPSLRCVAATADGSVELRWDMDGAGPLRRWADVKAYEVYVCHETDAPPDAAMWRMMDLTRAPLPAGCVLVDCPPGVHHVAVRAVDVHDRRAPFTKKTFTVGRR